MLKKINQRYDTCYESISDTFERRVVTMDIPALSMYMAQSQTLSQVGIALLDKNLETVEGMGEDMTKMLERSVTPELGGNIDISL